MRRRLDGEAFLPFAGDWWAQPWWLGLDFATYDALLAWHINEAAKPDANTFPMMDYN